MKKLSILILPAIFIVVITIMYFTYFAKTGEIGSFDKFSPGSEINQGINVFVVKAKGFERDANGNIISFYAADKNNVEIKSYFSRTNSAGNCRCRSCRIAWAYARKYSYRCKDCNCKMKGYDMTGLSQIILGAFLLSIVHASIPNHWIPLVALSKSEKWNEKSTMGITAIAGLSHTLSTIIIGIIIGFLGYKLSDSYSFIVGVIAPSLLILLGIIYLILSFRENKHYHHHSHEIHIDDVNPRGQERKLPLQ